MKKTLYVYLLTSIWLFMASAYADGAHWSYRGNHGPTHWGDMGSQLCEKGAQQSPINVEMKQVRPLKGRGADFKIRYSVGPLNLVNNGHTIQAYIAEGSTVSFNGNVYHLEQFHFHTPSEHQINHRSYPMEMHLLGQDDEGHLLVIGLMIKEGKKNKEFASFWERLPAFEGQAITLDAQVAPNLSSIIPTVSHHLFYKGSLTTPPCTEDVQWVLFEQPLELSRTQLHKFRQLFSENHRPPQQVNDREVDED